MPSMQNDENELDENVPMNRKNSRIQDKGKNDRMRFRQKKNASLFYPEDQSKVSWDLFITLILLISCILTPYRIAFSNSDEEETLGWQIVGYGIDFLFFLDIIVIMNSAFYDDEFQIVEDRVIIVKAYLTSWFCVDLLAILPFELILKGTTDNY